MKTARPHYLTIFEHWPSVKWISITMPIFVALLVTGHFVFAAAFAEARYPVTSFAAQFSFSGPTVKSYYAVLQQQGTLEYYARAQWLDFVFIAGLAGTVFFVSIIFTRIQPPHSTMRHLNLYALPFVMLSPLADALENVLILTTLAYPTTFPDWMAVAGSSLDVLKYISGPGLGSLLTIINIGALIYTRILVRRHAGTTAEDIQNPL